MNNIPVEKVDIMLYAGKWFSLFSTPTFSTVHWRQVIETYVIHPDGYYAVFTTYKVVNEKQTKYFRSKLFVVRGTNNAQFKLQTLWPLKTDYWVIELAEDYSYAVVGHPKLKKLVIMSRTPGLPSDLLESIFDRCAQRGYDTSKLIAQNHKYNAQKMSPSL